MFSRPGRRVYRLNKTSPVFPLQQPETNPNLDLPTTKIRLPTPKIRRSPHDQNTPISPRPKYADLPTTKICEGRLNWHRRPSHFRRRTTFGIRVSSPYRPAFQLFNGPRAQTCSKKLYHKYQFLRSELPSPPLSPSLHTNTPPENTKPHFWQNFLGKILRPTFC